MAASAYSLPMDTANTAAIYIAAGAAYAAVLVDAAAVAAKTA